MSAGAPAVAIVGAGRAGTSLAAALAAAGFPVTLLARRALDAPAGVALRYPADAWAPALAAAAIVVLAVPDDAVAEVAGRIAPALGAGQVALHCAGRHGLEVLEAIAARGAATAAWHPLQSLTGGASGAARLCGAWAALEGTPAAVEAANALSRALGMQAVALPAGARPRYHAAAALLSNGTATLAALAAELLAEAGIAPPDADAMLGPLLQGTAANVAELGADAALTGPIRRGEAETVRAHLAALPAARRPLYVALGRETLRVARRAGLDAGAAAEVARVLDEA